MTAGQSIIGKADDGVADITAGSNNITLTAGKDIAGTNAGERLELAAGSQLKATATTGDVRVEGLGALTLTNVDATAGNADITAAGLITATQLTAGKNVTVVGANGIDITNIIAGQNADIKATTGDITSGTLKATAGSATVEATAGKVTVGSFTAGTDVKVTAGQSIIGKADDGVADITAGSNNITLTAGKDIAGTNAGERLELAAGSQLKATATTGDVRVEGLGALTLTNVDATAGNADITAAGLITATQLTAGKNVTVVGANGIDITNIIAGQNADIKATTGDITSGTLKATAGSATVEATAGKVTVGSFTAAQT